VGVDSGRSLAGLLSDLPTRLFLLYGALDKSLVGGKGERLGLCQAVLLDAGHAHVTRALKDAAIEWQGLELRKGFGIGCGLWPIKNLFINFFFNCVFYCHCILYSRTDTGHQVGRLGDCQCLGPVVVVAVLDAVVVALVLVHQLVFPLLAGRRRCHVRGHLPSRGRGGHGLVVDVERRRGQLGAETLGSA